MYKASKLELPSNLQCKFDIIDNQEKYNLRSKNKFKVKYARTTKMQHCLSVFGVKVYNLLPNFIVSLPNIKLFKNKLKKHILEQYSLNLCQTKWTL